jgi:O-methyltransferase
VEKVLSFIIRLRRHGILGILRLIPVNVAYYTPKAIKEYVKQVFGRLPIVYDYFWRRNNPSERIAFERFITTAAGGREERKSIVKAISETHRWVECGHTQREMLEVIAQILNFPVNIDGVIVEAGSFKGGSAAKFSRACAYRNRRLIIFDSFEGLPDNHEPHDRTIFGETASFPKGAYEGSLDLVRHNIRKYGRLEVCEFVKGWFEDTMPAFDKPIIAGYVDVDLASSTRTCMKYLFPHLVPGGVIFSQDGHLPLVINVLDDDYFWENEVGVKRPRMVGLGLRKLVQIWKD